MENMPNQFMHLRDQVAQYYTRKVEDHGPSAQGVDWSSAESQILRFEQLLKICDRSRPFSLLDYGCGYGALLDYMDEIGIGDGYRGFDIATTMIRHANFSHPRHERRTFCK